MSKIALDDLNNPQIWKELSVIVCVRPDRDILPIRAKYSNKHVYNIGLNHVTSKRLLWFCLADVIGSKILTGKTPEIVKAIRFIPKGTQKLKEISILGEKINPYADVFKKIVEKREELKDADDPQEHILKIIANSTSYGIYAQINTENRKSQVDVYSLEHFKAFTNKSERQGERFNSILATFITSGSRLILAIVEAILARHGKTHAFCDTDSMAIPSDMVDIIQNYFQKLNPYCFDKPLFKLEEENFDEKGNLFGLWFFGISSKRYVLYNMVDGKIVIRKHSSHGLGHLKDPFSSEDWEKEFWTDILEYHYKIKSIDEINEKYSGYYAVSQMTISTPNLLRRFGKLNKGKPYEKKIKPFNFCLVGFGNEAVKPLCAYKKDSQEAVFDEFIDYGSGQVMSGLQYWQNLSQIFWDYLNHKESKFDGNTGILTRKNLLISSIAVIGKESNDLEENEVFGLDDETYLKYQNNKIPIEKALNLTPKKAKIIGISKNQLLRIKRAIRRKSCNFRTKTLQKLTRID